MKFSFLPCAIVLGAIAFLSSLYLSYSSGQGQNNKDITLTTGILYPEDYRPLAKFELLDQHNSIFSNSQLNNVWSLVFFGYTYCPDVCPLTMSTMQQIKASLNEHAASKDLQFVFISVDPKRDTPARLKEYTDYFDTSFVSLTGDHLQIQKLAKSIGVFYSPPQSAGEHYILDHSAGIFLVNPEARLSALFSAPHSVEAIVHDYLAIHKQNG